MNGFSQRGFTLLELLVAILVAGVIITFGVPNLLEFSRNNAITAAANDMQSAIMTARTTAVRRRRPVTLCASPNPLDVAPSCNADGTGATGFIVWEDEDADASIDGGELLVLQSEYPDTITIFASNGYINFDGSGFLNDIPGLGLSVRSLLMCDQRGNVVASGSLSAARAIQISNTGRSHILNEVATIAPVVAALGAACP